MLDLGRQGLTGCPMGWAFQVEKKGSLMVGSMWTAYCLQLDMSNLVTANKNYKYLLVAIDVYSRNF